MAMARPLLHKEVFAALLEVPTFGFIKSLASLLHVADGLVDEGPLQVLGHTPKPGKEGRASFIFALLEALFLAAHGASYLLPDGIVHHT